MSFFKNRWVKRIALVISPLVIIAVLVGATFAWLFIPWVADPDFPEPQGDLEAYQQDLTYLTEYANYEKAFDDSTKKSAFINYINEEKKNLDAMNPAKFELVVARGIALADNGHTNVSPIGRSTRVNHFPIRTGPFEDGEFVVQAMKDQADLLGAEIIAIEGHPIDEVVRAFIPYFGGIERRSRFFSHMFIMSPDLLHAQGISASPNAVEFTFRLSDSTIINRTLSGIKPVNGSRQPFGRELMDYRLPKDDQDGWVYLMKDKHPPLYLSEPDKPYLYSYLEELKGAYVKINFNQDIGEFSLVDWLDNVKEDLQKCEPNFAIVDLRFNGGGTDATATFSKQLPELVRNDGPIYILISRETFSAAIAAAAQFKKFGGKRARIIGSPVGDRLRFVANGGAIFTLPNSKISIRVWSTIEDYENGCWDWTECFWLSPFFRESGVGNLDPDIVIPVRFRDYAGNRDAAFEAILADLDL